MKIEKNTDKKRPIIRLKYQEVSSTNDVVKELLNDENIVVVTAEKQTKGRGRNGKKWMSETGNIFCSVGFRHKTQKSMKELNSYQVIGCLAVKHVLEELLILNIFSLKYPNDVLAQDGTKLKKIAGILVENEFFGSECKSTIIGIGINIGQIEFQDDLKEKAVSLRNLGIKMAKELIEHTLIEKIVNYMDSSTDEILKLWVQELNVVGKNIHLVAENGIWNVIDILEDGRMKAKNIETEIEKIIDNGDSIIYENIKNKFSSCGAIDIGNSCLKMLVGDEYFSLNLQNNWQNEFCEIIEKFAKNEMRIGISSVNPKILAKVMVILQKYTTIKIELMQKIIHQQSEIIKINGVENMGMDRILGLIGAMAKFEPPLITIDCGTAMTINVVNEEKECLGGAIIAGISTQLRALSYFTEQLPEVLPENIRLSTGKNTKDAMILGAVSGAAGSVKEIVGQIGLLDLKINDFPVIITGGEGQILKNALENWEIQTEFFPNLVLEGIIELIKVC